MKLPHERRRDDQQWVLDWIVKNSGRVQNLAYDGREVPPEVKSYPMIPKHMGRKGMHEERIARGAEKAGHRHTALEAYARAVNSYHYAQHAIFQDDHAEKLHWYQRMAECFDGVIALSDYPIERVEVPWQGKQIQCALHLLPNRPKAPTILFIPGMDMVKELDRVDPRLALERGMNILYMDGPGQGMSNIRKIRVTHDNYEQAASAVVDYLLTRPEVDPDQIGVFGISMGSYWAIRTASYEHRIKAVATAASCLGDKTAIFEKASPRFKEVFMYMAGIHDEDVFDREVAAHMTTVGCGQKIQCPTLTVQGEFDPLSPIEDALDLHEEIQAPKELWVMEDDFHASRAMPGMAGMNGYPFIMDWLKDSMLNGRPAGYSLVRHIVPKSGSGPYEPVEIPAFVRQPVRR